MGKFDLSGFLGNSVKETTDSIGEAFDKNFTNKEEIQAGKNEVLKIVTNFSENISLKLLEISSLEANGNKLQRSWRPVLMYTLTFLILCTWFFYPMINLFAHSESLSEVIIAMRDNTDFWDVLKIGLGVFGGGRTLEKIATRITPAEGIKIRKKEKSLKEQLEDLHKLFEKGLITRDEYAKQKEIILKNA